jgi:hypothetical protein
MCKISKIRRNFTCWEFANFAYVELANMPGLRRIVFRFHQKTINIFYLCGLLVSNQ